MNKSENYTAAFILTEFLLALVAFLNVGEQWLKTHSIYVAVSCSLLIGAPVNAQQNNTAISALNLSVNLLAIPVKDSLVIADARTQQIFYRLPWPGQGVKYISFNATGSYLICADNQGRTIIYAIGRSAGLKVQELPLKTIAGVFDNHHSKLYLVHSKSWTGAKISTLEVASWKILTTVSAPSGIKAIGLNADGSLLGYIHDQNITEVSTNNLKTLRSHWERSAQDLLAFNPVNVDECVTTTAEHVIQIRDLARDSILIEIRAHQKPIRAIAYNADGRFLSSLDASGELNIWHLSARRRVAQLANVLQSPYWDEQGALHKWSIDSLGLLQAAKINIAEPGEQCCFTPVYPLPIEVIPQPLITYAPETGFLLGLSVTALINTLSLSAGQPYRPSVYHLSTAYGFGGKQWKNAISVNNYGNGKWHIIAQLQYNSHDKNYYFGIGRQLNRKDKQPYVNNNLAFYGTVSRFLSTNWAIGLKYDFSDYTKIQFQNDDILLPNGTAGGFLTGVGPSVQYDSRNDILFPTKGSLFELSYLNYGLLNIGSYGYNQLQFDYRKYISLGGNNNERGFAFQALADVTWGGNIPFYKLPYFTADRSFRGMWRNLYINQQIATVQTEFRSLFNKANPRLGYVLFASAADGAANFLKGYKPDIKFALGGGIRSQLLPKKRIYARVDYSFSNKGDYGILGGIGTAF